ASEKSGCSIDARSSFGTTSEMSRMKKSFCGCRSGSSAMTCLSLYLEPILTVQALESSSLGQEPASTIFRSLLSEPRFVTFGTEVRYFRNHGGIFYYYWQGVGGDLRTRNLLRR